MRPGIPESSPGLDAGRSYAEETPWISKGTEPFAVPSQRGHSTRREMRHPAIPRFVPVRPPRPGQRQGDSHDPG
ncbi:hypothetical protein PAMA_017716 [Pampus argenteus]